MAAFHEAPLKDDLKKCGVTQLVKENNSIQIVFGNQKVVIFDIHPAGILKTIENLKASARKEKIDTVLINKVVFLLVNEQNVYLEFLLVNGNSKGNNNFVKEEQLGPEQSNSNNDNNIDINTNTTNSQEEQEELSVSEAIRRKKGYVRIKGQVIGHSSVYNMILKDKIRCDNCGFHNDIDYSKKPVFRSPYKELSKCPMKSCTEGGLTLRAIPEYTTTIDVELQDPDRFNEIERIKIRLFEDDTKDVFAGKIVMITGHIHVVRENDTYSNKPTPVIYAESIEDIKKEETSLTEKDIQEVIDWKKSKDAEHKNIIDELVSYFAPDIIGYEHVKKGLLMVAANAGIPNNEKRIPKRLRINALLIGDPSSGGALVRIQPMLIEDPTGNIDSNPNLEDAAKVLINVRKANSQQNLQLA